MIGVRMGEEHRSQAGEVQSRVGERGRRPAVAVDNLNPWTEAKVDTKNPGSGPLLAAVGLAYIAGCALAIALHFTPAGTWLGLAPVPFTTLAVLLLAVLLLTVAACLTALQAAKVAYHRATGHWLCPPHPANASESAGIQRPMIQARRRGSRLLGSASGQARALQ